GAESVGAHKTSMLQDVEAGRSLETEALIGAILELGKMTETPAPAKAKPDPRAENQGRSPFLTFVDGSIRLSLTSTWAAAGLFVGLTTLLVAFEFGKRQGFTGGVEAGRASYAAEATSEIDLARLQEPTTHIVAGLLDNVPGTDPATRAGGKTKLAPVAKTSWIRDYTYIVAQEFAGGQAESARQARAFLAKDGVETAMVIQPGGSIQLITTQGFNRRDAAQKKMAAAALEKVHKIGKRFYAQGGGYKLSGYFKTLKGDSW
ncbi:MAG: hypothetical protein IH987_01930, partial [Planctomycetes bacterium]|nr:hypothetical protein [Planctomycetota bacterium]